MAQQVSIENSIRMSLKLPIFTDSLPNGDYVAVSGDTIQFATGDSTKEHTIIINQDTGCEDLETFTSTIRLSSGIPIIEITHPEATITIDDSSEEECGKPRILPFIKKWSDFLF